MMRWVRIGGSAGARVCGLAGVEVRAREEDKVYREKTQDLNLGWLLLARENWSNFSDVKNALEGLSLPASVLDSLALVSDKLFGHVVNSNLEVRTSVAINPATGAAEDGALFTYEALPRATVLVWEVTCRAPEHFGRTASPKPHDVVRKAHPLLEALGIGGMGSRGMGRLRVLDSKEVTR